MPIGPVMCTAGSAPVRSACSSASGNRGWTPLPAAASWLSRISIAARTASSGQSRRSPTPAAWLAGAAGRGASASPAVDDDVAVGPDAGRPPVDGTGDAGRVRLLVRLADPVPHRGVHDDRRALLGHPNDVRARQGGPVDNDAQFVGHRLILAASAARRPPASVRPTSRSSRAAGSRPTPGSGDAPDHAVPQEGVVGHELVDGLPRREHRHGAHRIVGESAHEQQHAAPVELVDPRPVRREVLHREPFRVLGQVVEQDVLHADPSVSASMASASAARMRVHPVAKAPAA